MNISGYQDNNFHDGSTQILGDLVIDGKLTLGGATGQSEYLDSGDYSGTILGVPTHWLSMGLKTGTQYRYEKNGNIVQVYLYLRGEIKANTQFPQISVNVPSTDLFNVGHTGNAYAYSSFILPTGRQIYTTTNQLITTSGISGQTSILIYYEGNSATNNQETVDFFVHLVYKLVGLDIPATVLVSGGSGQGDVQNPMLETLDAGGYDILNVGTMSATFVSAPNVVSNPLSGDIDANNNKINNCTEIKTTGQQLRIIGGPLHFENDSGLTDILVSNNFDMSGKDIKDVNELKVSTLRSNAGNILTTSGINCNNNNLLQVGNLQVGTISSQFSEVRYLTTLNMNSNDIISANNITSFNDLTMDATSGTAKMIGSAKAIVESPDDVEIICDLGSSVRLTSNLTLRGSTIFLNSTTGTIDCANGNLNNVDFVTNPDNTIVITGSKIEMKTNPPGGITEFYTSIDMNNNRNINNAGSITTKSLNTIKYIRTEADFTDPLLLSGVYVIIGTVTITDPLNIVGSCLIAGYNNTSTLLFNITDGIENTYCLRNTNNSGNVELKDFIFTNQCSSTRAGSLFSNTAVNTNIVRVSNVQYYNCKNNFMLRILGYELVELINNTFRYNYGGTSGPMCSIDSAKNAIIECSEFYNNYQLGNTSLIYSSTLLSISGTNNNISITGNQFATYGAGSLGGINISNLATTNRVIIDGNVFDAEGGSDPLKLLNVDLSIHKGVICNENTGIVSCKAALEGLVNSNTVYTATVLNTWVPVDLTGFAVGNISRFVTGLSPYSFEYDAKNPIKALISINCNASQDTGGTDDIRLGLSVNSVVSVYIEASLDSKQNKNLSLTTVVDLSFGDVIQIVCQNVTAGSDANGFLAISLNASLIEI